MGLQMSKKNIFLFVMISLNYKCSKDAKTGLGLVRECLVQILLHYLESQVDGQSSSSTSTNTRALLYQEPFVSSLNSTEALLQHKIDF